MNNYVIILRGTRIYCASYKAALDVYNSIHDRSKKLLVDGKYMHQFKVFSTGCMSIGKTYNYEVKHITTR